MGIGDWLNGRVDAGSYAGSSPAAEDVGARADIIHIRSLDFVGMSTRSRNGRFASRGPTADPTRPR